MKPNRTNFLSQPLARPRPGNSGCRAYPLAKVPAAAQNIRLRALLAVVSLAVLVAGSLEARNTVTNNTSKTIRKQINGRPWVTLSPGESDNADNDGANDMTLRIETVDSALDYFAIVQLPQDGTARVEEEDRSRMGLPPNLYCISETASGAAYDVSNYGVRVNRRNVHFVVSADCQYDRVIGTPNESQSNRKANSDDVNRVMVDRCNRTPDMRGAIYAGDLIQWGDDMRRNFGNYKASFGDDDNLRFLFDGLGNHDYEAASPFDYMLDHVADRKHHTAKSLKDSAGRPHYSWDWGDVHFVQLNLFPGNAPSGVGEFAELDPLHSLDFLVRDLANLVGNSGRPVVLIHHYPPGNNCASDAQWVAYWNAIANYNVAVILAGHSHPDASSDTYDAWSRPNGAVGGPISIPTFVTGASMGNEHWDYPRGDGPDPNDPKGNAHYQRGQGAFLDVRIDDSQIYVQRINNFEQLQHEYTLPLRRSGPLYAESGYIGIGGGTSVAPYNTVGNAMSALVGATNSVDIKLSGGTYRESGTLKINRPSRLFPRTSGQAATIKP